MIERSTMRTAGATVVLVLVVLILAGVAFIYSGVYNIAATDPHAALVRSALNATQERSVEERANEVPAPPPVDSAQLWHGFVHYRAMCVVCHGAPGVERGEIGKGLNPTPPDLSEEAPEWSARALFWIVKHGFKMAGMPAFGPTHTDEEIWGIVAFVERLPQMSAAEYREWVARLDAAGGGDHGGPGHTHGGAVAQPAADTAETGHTHAPGTPAHEH